MPRNSRGISGGRTSAIPQTSGQADSSSLFPGTQEISSLISEFNPDNKHSETAKDWIAGLEVLGEIYSWEPRKMMLYASIRLGGPAKVWYSAQKAKLNTWEIFKEKIVRNFPEVLKRSEIQKKLMNMKKGANQSVVNYYQEVVALAGKIGWDETLIKEHIIQGLPNFSWRVAMAQEQNSDMDQFLYKLIQMEKVSQCDEERRCGIKRKRYKKSAITLAHDEVPRGLSESSNDSTEEDKEPQDSSGSGDVTQQVESTNKIVKDKKVQPKSPRVEESTRKITCYFCSEEGHIARKCPIRLKGGSKIGKTTGESSKTSQK